MRRAARHQGFFPGALDHPDQLAEIVADVTALRTREGGHGTEPYDFVAALPPGTDPRPYAAVGATWWLVGFPEDAISVDQIRGVVRDGPAETGRTTPMLRSQPAAEQRPKEDPA
jgi:hypothetical protein